MSAPDEPIAIAPLQPDESALWQSFIAASPNATLFHDLEFLGYHPAGRFRFHHLIVRRAGKPIAVVPGGLVGDGERPVFASPVGASIGGPALAKGVSLAAMLAVVEALQAHARAAGWGGVDVTLAPDIYHPDTASLVGFALHRSGFRLDNRALCQVLPLSDGSGDIFEQTFLRRQLSPVRAARRRGVTVTEHGLDGLDRFLALFDDTYRRHGATATHSADEIADLLRRLPERVSVCLASLGDTPVAGLLVLRLTPRVATTFYICPSTAHAQEHGAAAAIAGLMSRLGATGYRHLDLGPSATGQHINPGSVFFKEGLGAVGHCRDRWVWTP